MPDSHLFDSRLFDVFNDLRYAFVDERALILGAVFLSVFLAVLAAAAALRRPDAATARMRALAIRGRTGATLRHGLDGEGTRDLIRKLERTLVPTDGRKRSYAQQRLVQAGYYHPRALPVYYALRCALALGLPVLALAAWPLLGGSMSVRTMYFVGVGAAALGFFGPAVFLSQRVEIRQKAVREAFPDTLDMLLVCVEAGLGLNAAIARVASELKDAHPLLSEHFLILGLEMQAGIARDAALRNLGARIGLDEVNALVTLLVQADSMGVSIAQTLRVYAADMRRKRLVKAEEHANKLPVHMVLPLAAFIMPSFLIVICIPTVIRVLRVLLPALSGH
ncbi:type II secretion system F family protein [Azospirillum rugosum]|uniref:Tight adherence protein C n=1 Tax=Azospirillum rugosum TaxID=416170 RepID=A0ABS4SMG5_9PROT|nr:type II secretion system F family protein [Azospirillum rugosum]MBP2293761.1 tight adherence protein C [Azospirillum rugosum]MDQ0527306.1 tight adherence protein C [Azospirillum rugosum]